MYKFVICDDEGKMTIVPVVRDVISIGRKEGNTIRLTDRNVSRNHARLMRKSDAFYVEDLGSLLGTKVNGKVVRSGFERVEPGDRISIGDYSLSVRTDVASDMPMGRQVTSENETGIGKVTPHARLVMIAGPEPGREVNLTHELYVVGRSEEANFQIDDPSISRTHIRIDREDGLWTVSDLDSINGILINGIRKDDYTLKPGDVLELGAVKMRFVAPGEPYEYRSTEDDARRRDMASRKAGSLKLAWGISVAALLAVAAVVVFMMSGGSRDQKAAVTVLDLDEKQQSYTFEDMMEMGKDKIQIEEWSEAAHMFAMALQKSPGNRAAREMKDLSIRESDAQKAFTTGLAAGEAKDWRHAIEAFSSIPRSSQYYDESQIAKATMELCDEIHKNARQAISKGDLALASSLLSEVGEINETPDLCRENTQKMLQEIRSRQEAEGFQRAEAPASKEDSQNLPKNPY